LADIPYLTDDRGDVDDPATASGMVNISVEAFLGDLLGAAVDMGFKVRGWRVRRS